MDDQRLSNLLFLASFASLAMPGCSSDGNTAEDEDDGFYAVPSAPVGNPLEHDNELTGGPSDPTGLLPVDPCTAYATRALECADEYYQEYYGASMEQYIADCQEGLERLGNLDGPVCRGLAEELLACLARQSCESFACAAEEFALARSCFGDGGGGGSTGF